MNDTRCPRLALVTVFMLALPKGAAWAQDVQPVDDEPAADSEPVDPPSVPAEVDDSPVGPEEPPDEDEPADVSAGPSDFEDEARPAIVGKRLRLDDAIDLALRRHPQLVAVRERVRAAETRVGQAQAAYYPRVDGWLQYVRASENGSLASFHNAPGMSRVGGSIRDGVEWHHSFNNYLVAITAQQMLYDFGRTKGAVGAQRAYVKAAKMTEKLVEQRVIFGVMQAFYEVRAAREVVRVAEEARRTNIGILELAQAGHDAGLRPPSEKARAEADLAAAEVALIRARVDLDLARARVANAVGAAGESYEPVDEALPAPQSPLREEESIQIAVRNRPELRALDFEREGLSQTLNSVKARQRPRFDALASVNSRGHVHLNHPSGQDPYQRFNFNVGVMINIPLFQGLLIRRQKEELHAQMSAIDGDQEAIRQAVILEVKQALAIVHAADQAVKASRKGVEAARVALETSEGRYQAGLGTLIELVDAQATYVSARSQYVQATYDRHLARAVLGLAMGQPSSISAPTRGAISPPG